MRRVTAEPMVDYAAAMVPPLPRLGRYDIDSLDNRDPAWLGWLCRTFGGLVRAYFRAELRGTERIPEGPALYVGNHNGGVTAPEGVLLYTQLHQRFGVDDLPYGLGHEVPLRVPGLQQLLAPLGVVRAGQATGLRLLRAGHKVLVYPGGDLEAMRPFRHRKRIVFGGRRGYIRLALRAGVPILPVVAAGAHSVLLIIDDLRWLARATGLARRVRLKVLPLTLSIPWGLTLGPPPLYLPYPSRVLMEVLPPVHFERSGEAAAADAGYVRQCADRVEGAMQATLERLHDERGPLGL